MFWGLIFGLMGFAVLAGLFIAFVIGVIPTVYCLPYLAWFGWNAGTKGIPKQLSFGGNAYAAIWHQAGNATKLYTSWFTHKPHGITRF